MRYEQIGGKGFISGQFGRIGSAVSLALAGATVVDIRVAGCRKDPGMPAHYAKAELAKRAQSHDSKTVSDK